MKLRTRLQQLERRAAVLAVPQLEEVADEQWSAWCRGGCSGLSPPAGPRSAKYTAEEWAAHHRFLLALCCRSVGRPAPPGMTVEESRQVEETRTFFSSIDPAGQLTLPRQARLAPYAGVIGRFLADAGGGIVPPASGRGEST